MSFYRSHFRKYMVYAITSFTAYLVWILADTSFCACVHPLPLQLPLLITIVLRIFIPDERLEVAV